MDVTVAICTRNRCEPLRETLAGLERVDVPQGLAWELLVVDNGSTDGTAELLAAPSALPLRSVREPLPGLSHARNRALDEARGALVVWTDDDVTVRQDWLRAYVEGAARWPDAAYFGGVARAAFLEQVPDWIAGELERAESVYAIRNLGAEERRLEPNDDVYGLNWALRRRAVEGLRFDPRLGAGHGDFLLGEETQFMADMRNRGGFGVWLPSAVVHHRIPEARLREDYLRRYFVALGRTRVVLDPPARPLLRRVTLSMRLLRLQMLSALHGPATRPGGLRLLRKLEKVRGQLAARGRVPQ